MEVKSLYFVLFIPAVAFIYYLFPQRLRWLVLLFSSLFFVTYNSSTSLVVLISVIIINYILNQQFNKIKSEQKRQYFLWFTILVNLIILGLFKYYNAINRGSNFITDLLQTENPIPHIEWLLPLGISYYIFQAIGYSIDIYRGTEKPETHFGNFAVYLSFFPKLIAGPIEQAADFLPQLKGNITLKYQNISNGGRLILWGLFKKIIIAEHINEFIQPMFIDSPNHSGASLILALLLYTVEIYADFSGYTDIALGTARLFGIKLTANFRQPFYASSLTDFWRRWHISLSTWVNNYIYNPLSIWISITFNFKKWGIIFSVFFSFLLLGIWHGADLTFAFFGGIQGAILGFEILTQKLRKQLAAKVSNLLYNTASRTLTIGAFSFSCIFFKANGINQAKGWILQMNPLKTNITDFNNDNIIYLIIAAIVYIFIDHQIFKNGFNNWCNSQHVILRWSVYALLIFAIITLSSVNTYPFIYSNF
ncbi:MAG: MBOAT family O-acyltransferase [Vicingaceae bacterium]